MSIAPVEVVLRGLVHLPSDGDANPLDLVQALAGANAASPSGTGCRLAVSVLGRPGKAWEPGLAEGALLPTLTPRGFLFHRPLPLRDLVCLAAEAHRELRELREALVRLSEILFGAGFAQRVVVLETPSRLTTSDPAPEPWATALGGVAKGCATITLRVQAGTHKAGTRLHRPREPWSIGRVPNDPIQRTIEVQHRVDLAGRALRRGDLWLAGQLLEQLRPAASAACDPQGVTDLCALMVEVAYEELWFVVCGGHREFKHPFVSAQLGSSAESAATRLKGLADKLVTVGDHVDPELGLRLSTLSAMVQDPGSVSPVLGGVKHYWAAVVNPDPAAAPPSLAEATLADAAVVYSRAHRALSGVLRSAAPGAHDTPEDRRRLLTQARQSAEVAVAAYAKAQDEAGLLFAGGLHALLGILIHLEGATQRPGDPGERELERQVTWVESLAALRGHFLGRNLRRVWTLVREAPRASCGAPPPAFKAALLREIAVLIGGSDEDAGKRPSQPCASATPSSEALEEGWPEDLEIDRELLVFCNFPYDWAYLPFRKALLLAVLSVGKIPILATDFITDPWDPNRPRKIDRLLRRCKFSVHDLVRARGEGLFNTSRHNMAWEAGLAYVLQKEGHQACFVGPSGISPYSFLSYLAVANAVTPYSTADDLCRTVRGFFPTPDEGAVTPAPPELPALSNELEPFLKFGPQQRRAWYERVQRDPA